MFTVFAVFINNEHAYLINKKITMSVLFEQEILTQAVWNLNDQAGTENWATVKTIGDNLDDSNPNQRYDAIISIYGFEAYFLLSYK